MPAKDTTFWVKREPCSQNSTPRRKAAKRIPRKTHPCRCHDDSPNGDEVIKGISFQNPCSAISQLRRVPRSFSKRAAETRGQGNECQENVGHSPDTHSPDNSVLANLRVLCVDPAAQLFGCGSGVLCLCALASLR